MSRTNSSMKARFSSSTRISSRPAAKRRTISGSSGHTIPSRSRRIPRRRRASSSRPRSERAWRSSWNVRPAGRDPEASRSGGAADLVEAVGRRVGRRGLQAPVGDLLLLLKAHRRHQAGPLGVVPGLSVDLQSRVDRDDPVRRHLGDAEAVCDGGDHLERHPQARVPRQRDPVQPQVDDLLHRAGGTGSGSGRRRRRAPPGWAASTTWPSGRRRPAPARLRWARCPLKLACLKHVAAAVHAGTLAVPHADQRRRGGPAGPAAAPGCPHTAVAASSSFTPGTHTTSWGLQQGHVALDGEVDGAQRRALVAGDEGGRAQSPGRVGAGAGRPAAAPPPGPRSAAPGPRSSVNF